MTNDKQHHPAQVFLWWISGIGLVCAGIWTVFVYLAPTPGPNAPDTATSDLANCPGTILQGIHGVSLSEPWKWTLDNAKGEALIYKPGGSVSGAVEMTCINNNWTAVIRNMPHGVEYNCSATISEQQIVDGKCFLSEGKSLKVTGTFSS